MGLDDATRVSWGRLDAADLDVSNRPSVPPRDTAFPGAEVLNMTSSPD